MCHRFMGRCDVTHALQDSCWKQTEGQPSGRLTALESHDAAYRDLGWGEQSSVPSFLKLWSYTRMPNHASRDGTAAWSEMTRAVARVCRDCAVGFSAVLFGLKVVLNARSPSYSTVYGVSVPSKVRLEATVTYAHTEVIVIEDNVSLRQRAHVVNTLARGLSVSIGSCWPSWQHA